MKTLRHQATLFEYDGPQVFEARDAIGGHYVGLAVEPDGPCDRCLVVGVAPERLDSFRAGRLDLRTLLLERPDPDWFLARLEGGIDHPFEIHPGSGSLLESGFLPDEGFFLCDEETPPSGAVTLVGALEQADTVLGTWGLAAEEGEYFGRTREGGPRLEGLRLGATYRFTCLEEAGSAVDGGRRAGNSTLVLVGHRPG